MHAEKQHRLIPSFIQVDELIHNLSSLVRIFYCKQVNRNIHAGLVYVLFCSNADKFVTIFCLVV